MFSGPAALLIVALNMILLISSVNTESGWSSEGKVDFKGTLCWGNKIQAYKESSSSANLALQFQGAPAFVASNILNCSPHISGVMSV